MEKQPHRKPGVKQRSAHGKYVKKSVSFSPEHIMALEAMMEKKGVGLSVLIYSIVNGELQRSSKAPSVPAQAEKIDTGQSTHSAVYKPRSSEDSIPEPWEL